MADTSPERFVRAPASLRLAVVRGLVLAGGLALIGGLTGLLLGLVAVPLSLIESWLWENPQRRTREVSILLAAWALALAGLLAACLQDTYVSVLIHQRAIDPFPPPGFGRPAPAERFDVAAALEAVGIEASRVWSPFGPSKRYTRPHTGPLLAVGALAFACALGLRVGMGRRSLVPLAPTALLFAYWGWMRGSASEGLLHLVPFLFAGAVYLGGLVGVYLLADGLMALLERAARRRLVRSQPP